MMKLKSKNILAVCLTWSVLMCASSAAISRPMEANRDLLPEAFPVYTFDESGVVNHPAQGTKERILPTSNMFSGIPGCYVACYTQNKRAGVYSVGGDIYVAAQIRVRGRYEGRICKPHGYERRDISAANYFKSLCEQEFYAKCKDMSCWAGGDTGGWFGIQ